MHFSIPDTQEFVDATANTYVGYNIHINGLFHCTVRYKQLYNLNEQLIKELDTALPPFPPKKFFPLTVNQQEERRLSLEKYIQTIGQNAVIKTSEILNGFLLNAQRETTDGSYEYENLDIFLLNGNRITVALSIGEHSGQVLQKVYKEIDLSERYHAYFSLFVVTQEDNHIYVLRRLQNFESPFITYKNMYTMGIRIAIGRNYWDIRHDLELLDDSVALNLLYVQTVAELNSGWILPGESEIQNHLRNLEKCEAKRKFMDVSRTLKYYGYIQFAPCFCDYPQPRTKVLVAIGRNELNLRILTSNDKAIEEIFKVTKMRCWRITTLQNRTSRCENDDDFILELSFEYLIAKNKLQWITISSEQAILMSICLQSMIDELLMQSVHAEKKQECTKKSWVYIMRDGHSRVIMGSSPVENTDRTKNTDEVHLSTKAEPLMKKITDKLSAIKVRKNSSDTKVSVSTVEKKNIQDYDIVENNAFHTIGDEDL